MILLILIILLSIISISLSIYRITNISPSSSSGKSPPIPRAQPTYKCTNSGCVKKKQGEKGYSPNDYKDKDTCIKNCKADCDMTNGGCVITPNGTYENIDACNSSQDCKVDCGPDGGCVITPNGKYDTVVSCNEDTNHCKADCGQLPNGSGTGCYYTKNGYFSNQEDCNTSCAERYSCTQTGDGCQNFLPNSKNSKWLAAPGRNPSYCTSNCNPHWKCDNSGCEPIYSNDPNYSAAYTNQSSCENACKSYRCIATSDDTSTWCQNKPGNGGYASQADCIRDCKFHYKCQQSGDGCKKIYPGDTDYRTYSGDPNYCADNCNPRWYCNDNGCVQIYSNDPNYNAAYPDNSSCEYACRASCDTTNGGCVRTSNGDYSTVEDCNTSQDCQVGCLDKGCAIQKYGSYSSIEDCNTNKYCHAECTSHGYCSVKEGGIHENVLSCNKDTNHCKVGCDMTNGGCVITPTGTHENIDACNTSTECKVSCDTTDGSCSIQKGGIYDTMASCTEQCKKIYYSCNPTTKTCDSTTNNPNIPTFSDINICNDYCSNKLTNSTYIVDPNWIKLDNQTLTGCSNNDYCNKHNSSLYTAMGIDSTTSNKYAGLFCEQNNCKIYVDGEKYRIINFGKASNSQAIQNKDYSNYSLAKTTPIPTCTDATDGRLYFGVYNDGNPSGNYNGKAYEYTITATNNLSNSSCIDAFVNHFNYNVNNDKPINSPSIDFNGNISVQNNTCTITGPCYEKNPVMQVGSNEYGWTPDANSSFPSEVYFIHPFDTTDDLTNCDNMNTSTNCTQNGDGNISLKEIPPTWKQHASLFQNPCILGSSAGFSTCEPNLNATKIKMNIFNGLYCEKGFSNIGGTKCNP